MKWNESVNDSDLKKISEVKFPVKKNAHDIIINGKPKDMFPEAGKPDSKYEDDRFGGMTVGAARKQQEKKYRSKLLIMQAEQKKNMGWELSPQEQFVIDNRDLLS